MKNASIIILVFVLFSINTLGQNKNPINDSILVSSIIDYTEIIKSHSTFDSLYYWRSFLYFLKNDTNKSLNDITKAIEISPDKGGFYNRKGYFYRGFGIYDSAVISYKKALSLDSLNSDTYLFLIDSYVHLKDFENAMGFFEKGLTSFIYRNDSIITITSGLFPDLYVIADIFEKAYSADTTQFISLYGAGYAFYVREDMDSAQYYFEKYIRKSPSDSVIAETYLMLGSIYLENDNIDKAMYYYRIAYEKNCELSDLTKAMLGVLDSINPVYYFYKGYTCYENDNIDSSIIFLKKYESMVSDDSIMDMAYFILGSDYLMKYDTINAAEYFKKAKVKGYDFSEIIKELKQAQKNK